MKENVQLICDSILTAITELEKNIGTLEDLNKKLFYIYELLIKHKNTENIESLNKACELICDNLTHEEHLKLREEVIKNYKQATAGKSPSKYKIITGIITIKESEI